MADMFKLMIYPLNGVHFSLQVSILNNIVMVAVFGFLVVVAMQDNWQQIQVEDWPLFSSVFYLLSILNGRW